MIDVQPVMDLSPATLVSPGGAVGALLRYVTTRLLDVGTLPYGTLAVDVVGSFALGLLTFGGAGGEATLFVGAGACGSFTTFSSFAHDTMRLAETGNLGRGVANALGTLLSALAAVGLAWLLLAREPVVARPPGRRRCSQRGSTYPVARGKRSA